jgi:hypothetical protein
MQADEALYTGCQLVNDLAESMLISSIKDKNITAILAWLRTHHPAYANRVEITANTKNPEEEKLTPEKQELLKKALEMASLIPGKKDENEPG